MRNRWKLYSLRRLRLKMAVTSLAKRLCFRTSIGNFSLWAHLPISQLSRFMITARLFLIRTFEGGARLWC
jgi:hypothetical protein